jgi:hypothetical protein
LARAKNTARATARRHTRETQRAELAAQEAGESEQTTDAPDKAAPRTSLFKVPNFREDIRLLPSLFKTRRLLWLPLGLLALGLALALVIDSLSADVANILELYLQFFFVPPALFVFFIAGFVAPRASYLVGFLYGIVAGTTWTIAILATGLAATPGTTTPTTSYDPLTVTLNMLGIGVVYGTLAAAFAAWYRDFLHGMQERSRQKRVEQEAKERAKRREERQEARKVAKRSTS